MYMYLSHSQRYRASNPRAIWLSIYALPLSYSQARVLRSLLYSFSEFKLFKTLGLLRIAFILGSDVKLPKTPYRCL